MRGERERDGVQEEYGLEAGGGRVGETGRKREGVRCKRVRVREREESERETTVQREECLGYPSV